MKNVGFFFFKVIDHFPKRGYSFKITVFVTLVSSFDYICIGIFDSVLLFT